GFGEPEPVCFNAFDDASGQLVAAVVVMMGSIFEGWVELFAQGGVKHPAHGVQIDQRHLLLFGHTPNGGGKISQCFGEHRSLAFHGSDEDGEAAALASFPDEMDEIGGEGGERAGTGPFVLLIVMPELNEQVIAC